MPDGLNAMIELLKQMHPDIIICDALSEKSDCLSLIKFIKEGKLTSHIPVILLSTAQQVDERIKGVESGADICLTLPFNVEYLKAVTEQLLKRNRSLKDYYKSSISAFELSDGKMLHQDDKEFIDKMLKIINDNISNTEISTKFIADEMGVSIRNLYRRLEGILNQTPTTIIKEYRLAKAEQLLTSTKLSIDEIIYKAGFVNRGTFFKCFCRQIRLHPPRYTARRSSPRSNRRSTKCPKSHRIRHRQCYRQCRNLCRPETAFPSVNPPTNSSPATDAAEPESLIIPLKKLVTVPSRRKNNCPELSS